MSDPTINQLLTSLKRLNKQVEKLGRKIDQLDILAYRYQRLSAAYKQLFELMDHMDAVVFEIRQDFDQIREACTWQTHSNMANAFNLSSGS